MFRATRRVRYLDNPPEDILPNKKTDSVGWFKRSPLFMPEWAARYFIKITGVRPERLQEITREDVISEGIEDTDSPDGFASLWDFINPKTKWDTNPLVWRYSFELLKTQVREDEKAIGLP